MNGIELHEYKCNYVNVLLGDKKHDTFDGVFFKRYLGAITYSYKNAQGFVYADNGYRGLVDGKHRYYPLVTIRPFYSQEARFATTCDPTLQDLARIVKQSWELFTK